MPVSYSKNKIHIYNYVEKNREKWNAYQNQYRNENNQEYNRVRMLNYYYKRSCDYDCEVKRLMSIKI